MQVNHTVFIHLHTLLIQLIVNFKQTTPPNALHICTFAITFSCRKRLALQRSAGILFCGLAGDFVVGRSVDISFPRSDKRVYHLTESECE